jgi:hypothetical protein
MGQARERFRRELDEAVRDFRAGDLDVAFTRLERAHILGQLRFADHAAAHFWMLRVGLARRDAREVCGQVLRLVATMPSHLIGWLPIGNTGGANVSPVKPMPLPPDLAPFFQGFSLRRQIARQALILAGVAILVVALLQQA